jgi:hypothetical protein
MNVESTLNNKHAYQIFHNIWPKDVCNISNTIYIIMLMLSMLVLFYITHEIHQFLIFHFDCYEKPNYDFMFVDVINTHVELDINL